MKLNKFTYLYSKPLGNHTLKIMKNNTWKLTTKPRKSWKYHGILSVWKGGNPGKCFKERNGEYRMVLKWQCYKFVGLIPPDLAKKYELCLPPYPGSEPCIELQSSPAADDNASANKDTKGLDSPSTPHKEKDKEKDKENAKQSCIW